MRTSRLHHSASMSRLDVQEMVGERSPSRVSKARLYFERPGSKRRQAPNAAAELPNVHPRRDFRKTPLVAINFGDPSGYLEAESDRQALLPVGASRHDGIAVAFGQKPHCCIGFREVAAHKSRGHRAAQPSSSYPPDLHGGPAIEPFAARSVATFLDGQDQALGRMTARLKTNADLIQESKIRHNPAAARGHARPCPRE